MPPNTRGSFDDSLESTYTLGLKKLSAYRFPATEYVIADTVDTPGFLTEEQLFSLRNEHDWEIGEYYGPHFDIGPGRLAERKLSMTVQLSDPADYTGGELLIYPEFVAGKERGSMTVFPSFMCHNVLPVKTGIRYSLVSWVAGPPFK